MTTKQDPAPLAGGDGTTSEEQRAPNSTKSDKCEGSSARLQRSTRPRPRRQPIDFAAVNKAALTAFPAVMARILPGGKRVGADSSRSIRAAPIVISEASKSTVGPAVGPTSPRATRAGIQSRSSPMSPTCRRARRQGCSRECWGWKSKGVAMDDASKFSQLSPNEIAAGSGPDDDEHVSPIPAHAPPLDVKLKRRKPEEVFWFHNEAGERLFAECRWNFEGGAKEVRPACFTDHGWKLVAYRGPRPSTTSTSSPICHSPVWLFEGPRKADRAGACFPSAVTTANAGGANAISRLISRPYAGASRSLARRR